jgi:hypothetical protein
MNISTLGTISIAASQVQFMLSFFHSTIVRPLRQVIHYFLRSVQHDNNFELEPIGADCHQIQLHLLVSRFRNEV